MAKQQAAYTWLARQAYLVKGEAVLGDPIEVVVLADSRSEALKIARSFVDDPDKELYLIKIEER